MFRIDAMSRTPIYEQLIDQTEKLLLLGVLRADEQLPSVRALSCTLSINPNTVQKAYNELLRRGILLSVPGKGVFIAADALDRLHEQSQSRLEAFRAAVRELKLAGIAEAELTAIIHELYSQRRDSDAASSACDQTV